MNSTTKTSANGDSVTLRELADHMFIKKLGLVIPETSHNSFRVMAAKARCMPRSGNLNRDNEAKIALEQAETSKKIKDLTVIESQYSKYLQKFKTHDKLRDQKHSSQSFWAFIQEQPISIKTKERLALKLNSPFRINLSEFENKELNVRKYISLLDSSDTEQDKEPVEPLKEFSSIKREQNPYYIPHQPVLSARGATSRGLRFFPKHTASGHISLGAGLGNMTARPYFASPSSRDKTSTMSQTEVTSEKRLVKPQPKQLIQVTESQRMSPTPQKLSTPGFMSKTTTDNFTSRTVRSGSTKLASARFRLPSRQSPGSSTKQELRDSKVQPVTRESTWRPSFMQPNPQKVLLKDKFHQMMDRCDQLQQTGSSWFGKPVNRKWIEERSLSKSSTTAYFRPIPYMQAKRNRRPEPSTQAEFSAFTPERSSPTENRRGLEQAIKLRLVQRTAHQDAESLVKHLESQVEQELHQVSPEVLARSPRTGATQKTFFKKKTGNQGFSPRNNSPDNAVALQANMLHNLISFGNPNATKKEVVERMIEFKDVGGRKLAQSEMQMLAETRNFYITNPKGK